MPTPQALAENHFQTHDGVSLFYRHRPAQGRRRGAVVMFHRGHEHSGRMAHLIDELDLPDFDFFAWDARGHGLSPGERGHSPSFGTSVRDVQTFIEHIQAQHGVDAGDIEWWAGGEVWRSAPGSVLVKQPGDVHRDLARRGPTTFTVVTLPFDDATRMQAEGRAAALPHLERDDRRAAPFHRLLDAVTANRDRLSLEVAIAEAIGALAVISKPPAYSRPVRRAKEYLRAHLTDAITLDDLVAHAGLDKYHLCRAFRAQVGMPPHAYLTHLRIARAKELLLRGVRASDVAPQVGLYDQAQLTRHFRRLVGTTPARYRG